MFDRECGSGRQWGCCGDSLCLIEAGHDCVGGACVCSDTVLEERECTNGCGWAGSGYACL